MHGAAQPFIFNGYMASCFMNTTKHENLMSHQRT